MERFRERKHDYIFWYVPVLVSKVNSNIVGHELDNWAFSGDRMLTRQVSKAQDITTEWIAKH